VAFTCGIEQYAHTLAVTCTKVNVAANATTKAIVAATISKTLDMDHLDNARECSWSSASQESFSHSAWTSHVDQPSTTVKRMHMYVVQ
jgi:RES domain-containing protein